jgi:hypothetical protein
VNFAGNGPYHIIDCRSGSDEAGYQPAYAGPTYGLQVYNSSGGGYTWNSSTCGFTTNT